LSVALSSAPAGEGWQTQPYGISGQRLPWNRPGYQGYSETARPPSLPPAVVSAAPERYTITITRMPLKPQGVDSNIFVVMARLPEHAQVWFNNQPTKLRGMMRYFESPPLTPGKHYLYTMRVVWYENGKWVHKIENVPVEAGEMRCISLMPANIAENLAKLSAEDRTLAELQGVCPITGNPLGARGVLAKVTLKEQPVLLCCKLCIQKAQAEPDKTLAKLKEPKEKAGGTQKK
jgi:uncharacterized protein (TIGR03000 family)